MSLQSEMDEFLDGEISKTNDLGVKSLKKKNRLSDEARGFKRAYLLIKAIRNNPRQSFDFQTIKEKMREKMEEYTQ